MLMSSKVGLLSLTASCITELSSDDIAAVSGGDQHTYSWGYAIGKWLREFAEANHADPMNAALRE